MPSQTKDLYLECNDRGMKEMEFESMFCNYCRQTRCSRSGWSKTSWEDRINSQVDRLLIKPNLRAQSESDRWSDIPNFEYPPETLEIWGSPQEVLDVLSDIEEDKKEEPTPRLEDEESLEDKEIEILEASEQETTPNAPKMTKPSNKPPKRVNTKAQEIYIGGAPESKPVKEVHDPWAPATPTVKVGGTFKMGG